MSDDTELLKDALASPDYRRTPIGPDDWLSLGVTVANLAVSGNANHGIFKGGYLWLVGDSETGKSWWALTILAEAVENSNFDDYEFHYADVERGVLMDVPHYFGQGTFDRLNLSHPTTADEWYREVYKRQANGVKSVEILDSMDALDTEADLNKYEKGMRPRKSDDDKVKGSYGMAKAKMNSDNIKRLVTRIGENGSILIVINQTREDVGNPFGGTKASGGKALRFYAHCQLWTSLRGRLKRDVLGREREYGSLIKLDTRKNRVSGRHRSVVVPFLTGFGLDDVGACVDYLRDEGHWGKDGKFAAPEFAFTGTREQLVRLIQDNDQERELQILTQMVWREIEDKIMVVRKRRYT